MKKKPINKEATKINDGYQPLSQTGGYQPTKGNLDRNNPPGKSSPTPSNRNRNSNVSQKSPADRK